MMDARSRLGDGAGADRDLDLLGLLEVRCRSMMIDDEPSSAEAAQASIDQDQRELGLDVTMKKLSIINNPQQMGRSR